MKAFAYASDGNNYGIECGIVFADTDEEAKEILGDKMFVGEITEVSMDKKGYTEIGSYWE